MPQCCIVGITVFFSPYHNWAPQQSVLPQICPAGGWGSHRWRQPEHCPTQHTASAGQPATAARSHSLTHWNPVAWTQTNTKGTNGHVVRTWICRKKTCYCGSVHEAALCKSSLAVYELKLAWHSLAQPSSVQTVGLSGAVLEDTPCRGKLSLCLASSAGKWSSFQFCHNVSIIHHMAVRQFHWL